MRRVSAREIRVTGERQFPLEQFEVFVETILKADEEDVVDSSSERVATAEPVRVTRVEMPDPAHCVFGLTSELRILRRERRAEAGPASRRSKTLAVRPRSTDSGTADDPRVAGR